MNALAVCIGTLPPRPAAAAPATCPGDPAAGAEIPRHGFADRDIPACLTGHGPAPTSDLHVLPRLHGQNAQYLEHRLAYFYGAEEDDVQDINPMPIFARQMTDAERADVASWFAMQEPLPKVIDLAEERTLPAPDAPGETV